MLKSLIGKASIHPVLFYSGKLSGYCCWVLFAYERLVSASVSERSLGLDLASLVLFSIGMLLSAISMVNLGSSTTLGLPEHQTAFKSSGLYQYSRNPMYLGFNLLTIGSLIGAPSIWTLLLALLSLYTYHRIIRAEEQFLRERFGSVYLEYCQKVRRYC